MSLPTLAKDRGLRSGDFTLHPSFGLTGHHDTNLFSASESELNNAIRGATSIRFAPKLSLANDAASNVAMTLDAAGDARLYVSSNDNVSGQSGVGGSLHLDVSIGARKAIAFAPFIDFTRQLKANMFDALDGLDRNSGTVGARFEFHPGEVPERRPFNVAFMAAYAFDRFDSFDAAASDTVKTRLTGSWRFLPKTAAIIDSSWDFRFLTDDKNTLTKRGLASDSKPFRARLGLAGAITKRMSLEVTGGWGMSNNDTSAGGGLETYNNFLATAGVGIRPSESTRINLGYSHDFRDTYFGNFFDVHRGHAQLRQRIGSIMDLEANFAASYALSGAVDINKMGATKDYLITATAVPELGSSARRRKETQLEGNAKAIFEVSRYFGLEAGYNLRGVISQYKVAYSSNPTVPKAKPNAVIDAAEYTAHEIFATAIVRY